MTFGVDHVTTADIVIGRSLNALRLSNERTGEELRLHFATRAKLIEVRNTLNRLLTVSPLPQPEAHAVGSAAD